jgi:hypothetical protein
VLSLKAGGSLGTGDWRRRFGGYTWDGTGLEGNDSTGYWELEVRNWVGGRISRTLRRELLSSGSGNGTSRRGGVLRAEGGLRVDP